MKEVLIEYDNKAKDLKDAYQAKIQKDKDLIDFGWILTDCHDGFDGKQQTIATYF